MRLDQFLRASRLVLRRSIAQEMCEAGKVLIGDAATPVRASRAVRAGDVLTISRGDKRLTVRIVELPATKQVARNEAARLYEIIDTQITPATSDLISSNDFIVG